MKLSTIIKSIVSYSLLKSRIVSWKLNKISREHFLVLMYHRILPKEQATKNVEAGMYVTPESFKIHLQFLKENFNIYPISKLMDKSFIEKKDDKPACFLTFDDGWYDFYHYAYPILKEYNVPATVFLTTGFIGTDKWFWTDRLANILNRVSYHNAHQQKLNNLNVNDVIFKIDSFYGSDEKKIDFAINLLKKYKLDEIEQIIEKLEILWDVQPHFEGKAFLSWQEVGTMRESGLVEFGSHTHNHNLLDTISDEEIVFELEQSKKILNKSSIDDSFCTNFCYPNGNYNQNIISKVKDAGYPLAFTTKHDWESYNFNPLEIHRIAVHNDISFSRSLFASRIAKFF